MIPPRNTPMPATKIKVTRKHWAAVYGRIWNEMLYEVRWDSPVRILRELLVPLVLAILAWEATHKITWTVGVPVVVVAMLAAGVFLWKLVTVPPRMAAEHESKIAALEAAADAVENRKQVRGALGSLLAEGRLLMSRCADEESLAPEDDANLWGAAAEMVFRTHLDESYVARFHDGSGLPMTATSISSREHRNLWAAIGQRNARLQEFIRELV